MEAPVLLMVLVAAAVLVWPGRRRLVSGELAALEVGRADGVGDGRGSTSGTSGETGARGLVGRLRVIARQDPVVLVREAWRQRLSRRGSRRDGFEEALLGVLDALEPALIAGLTPARALRLAAPPEGSGGGSSPRGGDSGDVRTMVDDAVRAAEAGGSIGRVWQRWADESDSRTLGFVASAWLLSERTGAPLAEAVARAAARTRAELSRRRRVTAAVAGPRATVNVLSALPLVGPLFGLASGLDPAEVYLSSPLVVVSVAVGFVLLLVGRWWCRRLAESVLEPA